MMKPLKFIWSIVCFILFSLNISGQNIDIDTRQPGAADAISSDDNINLFGKGLFDVHTNGQIQASAEVIKIRIGEPDGFNLPFILMTGATNTVFGNADNNESTIADLISPTGGFVNGLFNGYIPIFQSDRNITKLKFSFSGGGRLLSGKDTLNTDLSIFGAAYLDGGLLFQTGAWTSDIGYQDGGVFWIQFKYSATIASKDKLTDIFGNEAENPQGLRLELGILIKDKVNIKFGAYIPQAGKQLPTLDKSAMRISLDYKVR